MTKASKYLFFDRFDSKLAKEWDYRPDHSTLEVLNGQCWISGGKPALLYQAGKPEWRDYKVEAEVFLSRIAKTGFVGISGRVSNDLKYGFRFGFCGDGRVILEKNVDGWISLASRDWSVEKQRWCMLALEMKGNHLKAYIDGKVVFELRDQDTTYRTIPYGGIGIDIRYAMASIRRISAEGQEVPIAAREVLVFKDNLSLVPGETAQLTAVVYPGEATDRSVTWRSSNPQIATVSADGLVTAVEVGVVEISAVSSSAPSLIDVCHVTVHKNSDCFYYVSPEGTIGGRGTVDAPFATIQEAQQEIRQRKAADGLPIGGVTVYLRGGDYRLTKSLEFTEEDSGELGREVVYRAYPHEEVRLLGSVAANPSLFHKVEDPAVISRLRPEAVEHVLVMDLKAQGITEYGQLETRGMGQDMKPMQMELTIADESYELAKYPNQGFNHVGKVLDGRKEPGAVFCYTDDRAENWTQAEDLWLYGYLENAYSDYYVGVSKVDTENKTFTLRHGTPRGVTEAPPFGGKHNKYCAYNLLEEIDLPGEYYIDRTRGLLYVWPRREITPNTRVELSVLSDPLLVIEGCRNVRFQSLIFENSRGMGVYEENCENLLFDSCVFRNLGMVAVDMGRGCAYRWQEQNKPAESLTRSRMIGNIKGYLWFHPDAQLYPGRNIGVLNCEMYDLGAGGVILNGGDRKTLQHGKNYVENCDIHHVNRIEKAYRGGVRMLGMGNLAMHNRFMYAEHMTIDLMGNDNLVEYNEIGYSTTACGDMGTIYHGVDPTYFGNVIRRNHIHDTGTGGHVLDIYNDGRGNGLTIEENVMGNIRTCWEGRSIFINGGQFNTTKGNRWYNTPLAYEYPPRWNNGQEFKEEVANDCTNWMIKMDINGPLWKKKYPNLSLLANVYRDLDYSPLNNVYMDTREYATLEELMSAPCFDAAIFQKMGRYKTTEK